MQTSLADASKVCISLTKNLKFSLYSKLVNTVNSGY